MGSIEAVVGSTHRMENCRFYNGNIVANHNRAEKTTHRKCLVWTSQFCQFSPVENDVIMLIKVCMKIDEIMWQNVNDFTNQFCAIDSGSLKCLPIRLNPCPVNVLYIFKNSVFFQGKIQPLPIRETQKIINNSKGRAIIKLSHSKKQAVQPLSPCF